MALASGVERLLLQTELDSVAMNRFGFLCVPADVILIFIKQRLALFGE